MVCNIDLWCNFYWLTGLISKNAMVDTIFEGRKEFPNGVEVMMGSNYNIVALYL